MVIASSAGGSGSIFELRDYPSSGINQNRYPWTYKLNVSNEIMAVHVYNLNYAMYGFHLEIQPIFTEPNQRIFVITHGRTMLLLKDWLILFSRNQILSQTLVKNTVHTAALRLHVEQHELMDNLTFTRCKSGSHCYNKLIDHCDGFVDCEYETDETECVADYSVSDYSPGESVVVIVLIGSVLLFMVYIVWRNCKGLYHPICFREDLRDCWKKYLAGKKWDQNIESYKQGNNWVIIATYRPYRLSTILLVMLQIA